MTLQHLIRINGRTHEIKRINKRSIQLHNNDTLWIQYPFVDVAKVVYRKGGKFVSELVILD